MLERNIKNCLMLSCIVALTLLAARSQAQTPSPSEKDSDRRAALRHITLDLLGRMPTEDETNAFLSDKSPHAYQMLIQRLTESKKTAEDLRDATDAERQQLYKQSLLNDYTRLIHQNIILKPQSPVAYMGVGVDLPDDVLRAQLDLPPGTGLVINYVDPNGPSKDLIHLHDVLQKLNDQILINGEQFSTLVKMHKQGEELTLTVVRQAKPTAIRVKLGEREIASENQDPARANLNVIYDPNTGNNNLKSLEWWSPVTMSYRDDPRQHILTATQVGPITLEDANTTAVLIQTANGNFLTVFDKPTAKLTFTGPVNNEQDWSALPEDLRNKFHAQWQSLPNGAATTPAPNGVPLLRDLPVAGRLFTLPATQPTQKEK
jgi:hypothetical protein